MCMKKKEREGGEGRERGREGGKEGGRERERERKRLPASLTASCSVGEDFCVEFLQFLKDSSQEVLRQRPKDHGGGGGRGYRCLQQWIK